MIQLRLLFAVLILQIITPPLHSTLIAEDLSQELTKYMEMLNVPGAAIAVIHKDGAVWKCTQGYRNLEEKTKVTSETLFPIGSSTKPFTTFLIAKYIDKGVLQWDTPLSELIGNFSLSDRYLTEHLTLRDALSHQSGLPRYDGIWLNRNLNRSKLKDLLKFVPTSYNYREDFIYQNNVFMLGGLALETQLGIPFETLIKEEILNPLNMYSTSLSLKEFLQSNNRACGYDNNQKTHLIDLEAIAPAAAINSNLDDLCLWAAMLIGKGENHISLEQWDEMTSVHIASSMFSNEQTLSRHINSEGYGLGWYILDFKNQNVIMHSGHVEGFSSNVALLPDHNMAIVVLSNAHNSVFPYIMTVRATEMIADLSPTPIDTQLEMLLNMHDDQCKTTLETVSTKPRTHDLIDYTGSYSDPAFGEIHLFLKNKQLYLNFHNFEFPLKHDTLNTFSIKNNEELVCFNEMKILFNCDFSGNISSVTIDLPTDVEHLTFKKELLKMKHLDIRPYVGKYLYNGWCVEIIETATGLEALIQNFYTFSLRAETKTRFITPSYEGYVIEFKESSEEDGSMTILLTTPQNEIYSGTKVED